MVVQLVWIGEQKVFYSYNDANAIGGTCVDVIFSKYNQ